MKRIVYIGMDVHSTNFTFCSLEPKLGGEDKFFGCMQSEADVKNVLKYIEGLKKELGDDVEFLCGYEAGCLGFSLYQHIVVPIWRTRGRVRVSIGQAAERGRKMENRGQR